MMRFGGVGHLEMFALNNIEQIGMYFIVVDRLVLS